MNNIHAKHIELGQGVVIHPSASIRGVNGSAEFIKIGDYTYIGADVQILCDHFEIGDYGKIHHQVTIHGYQPCRIGHNAWVGQFTIIDSIGGVYIGDNFGVGAHSQLWSHIKYGDTLEGCRFNSQKSLEIGNDVWLVGHCILSPVSVADKSMALAGSVITQNMEFNQIYAGTPARSISDKMGNQFAEVSELDKMTRLRQYLTDSGANPDKIKLILDAEDLPLEIGELSYFAIRQRKYTKRLKEDEVKFMKFLLPEKAKFTPF
jgi:acetyltransferase-like isoleucine patch superfamily enzyme